MRVSVVEFLTHGAAVKLGENRTIDKLFAFATGPAERTREAIHIYAFPQAPAEFKPSLRTVIQHRAGVRNARWNPVRAGSLVSCTGTGALYLWQDSSADWVNDEEMAECIGIPGSQSHFPLISP